MTQSPVRRRTIAQCGLGAVVVALLAGCAPSAPAPSAAPVSSTEAPATKPAPVVTLLEPTDNVFSGHIDMFRWSATEGADAYVVRILGSDGRTVFESPALTDTEVHLPKTVAFEPEAHTWTVTARTNGAVLAVSRVSRFTITP